MVARSAAGRLVRVSVYCDWRRRSAVTAEGKLPAILTRMSVAGSAAQETQRSALPARVDGAGRRPRVALVVGSGALKCLAAFGVMRVLRREHIPIDLVVACSGGSFCGLWVAEGGEDPDAFCQRLVEGWDGSFNRISYSSLLRAVLPRNFRRGQRLGLIDDRRLNRAIREYTGNRTFDELKVPLHLVATDYASGEQVVVSQGPIFDGMRATISIPLVLPPWRVGERALVDGALCDPLPIDVAIREGADVIIAIGFEDTLANSLGTAGAHLVHLTSIVSNHLCRSQYAFYNLAHHAEVVAIMPRPEFTVGIKDLHRVPELLEIGAQAAEREVAYLRQLLQPA